MVKFSQISVGTHFLYNGEKFKKESGTEAEQTLDDDTFIFGFHEDNFVQVVDGPDAVEA